MIGYSLLTGAWTLLTYALALVLLICASLSLGLYLTGQVSSMNAAMQTTFLFFCGGMFIGPLCLLAYRFLACPILWYANVVTSIVVLITAAPTLIVVLVSEENWGSLEVGLGICMVLYAASSIWVVHHQRLRQRRLLRENLESR